MTRRPGLLAEEPLSLSLNGQPLAVTMRTPGDDAELAVGFLFSQGLLTDPAEIGAIEEAGPGPERKAQRVNVLTADGVRVDPERLRATGRGMAITSACGVCGRSTIEDLLVLCGPLPDGPTVGREAVFRALRRLAGDQPLFAATGASHAAVAAGPDGEPLAAAEDVGRHNAVDKVVGRLFAAGSLEEATILAVSGRASFEMVQKAVVARIPVLASVSAATSLAADLAQAANATLCAFVRGDRMEVLAGEERLG